LKTLRNHYIDPQNRLFIHAGFTNMNGVNFEYFLKMFYWERTLWETALALHPAMAVDDPFYPAFSAIQGNLHRAHAGDQNRSNRPGAKSQYLER
jgi:serine/threonine protein phosphatase 1